MYIELVKLERLGHDTTVQNHIPLLIPPSLPSILLPLTLSYSSFTSLPDAPTCISPVAERPQHMLMRVAVGIHKEDIDAAIEVCILPYIVWLNTYTCHPFLDIDTPLHIHTLKPTHSFTYSHTKCP